MIDIKARKSEFEKPVAHLQDELRGIRTGRAHSSIVENIQVDCYGALTPLKGLASIAIPDARTLVITPWDASIVKDVEKAIANSSLGANPVNEGGNIRIALPQLTEENRAELAKAVGQKQEQARIAIRMVRDAIREEISRQEKEKEITQDDKFVLQKELDETTKQYTQEIDKIAAEKGKDIMTL